MLTSQNDLVLSVPEILRRVHAELVGLEAAMETLHPLVDLVANKVGSRDPDHLRAMQGIDHMEQMLLGLANFLHAVSNKASEAWQLDAQAAVQTITLGDLALRLRQQHEAMPRETDGDLEMFG